MRGEKYMDDINPCSHHQPTYRYKNSGICIACQQDIYKQITPEKRKEYRAANCERRKYTECTIKQGYLHGLTAAKQWHEAQKKMLVASGDTGVQIVAMHYWLQHNEQIAAIDYALTFEGGKRWQPTE